MLNAKTEKCSIPWILVVLRFFPLMVMQFLLGTCLRVNIRIVIMDILEIMEYQKALETVNNSFCFP